MPSNSVEYKGVPHHPVSAEYFRFTDDTGLTDMGPILRMFIVEEYDRDPSILERLKNHLDEFREIVAWNKEHPEDDT